MALYAGLVRVAAALLLLPLAHGEKVFSICLGEQPKPPTRAERALGVQTAMKVACTKEYTFEELCQIDFNVITYPQVGTLALNAFQRKPGDDAGFINHGLKPGDTGFLVCHGEPVVEVWDASSKPAEVTTVQFLEQRRRSMSTAEKNHPAVLPASCWGEFFTMEDIIGGKVFEIRKAILEDAGCHDGPFVCSCCHRRGWSPYIRGGKQAALLADADGRGDADKGCTTDLAAFSRLPPEDIVEKFQVFSLSNASASACSLHGKGRHGCWAGDPAERAGPVFYEKITTRFVAGDAEGRLEVVGHGDGEALRLDAAAARFSLLRADGTEVALDGNTCVQNRGRDLQPFDAGADREAPVTALLQGEKYAQTPATPAADAERLAAENDWLWKKLRELKGIHQAPAAPAQPAQANAAAAPPAPVASALPPVAPVQPVVQAAAPAPALAPVPPPTPPPVTHVTAPPNVWVLPPSVPLTAMMTEGTFTVNR